MHEMSIVVHLAKTLDELAKEQNLVTVGNVTLQVGEASGIMTDFFEDCWNFYKEKYPVLIDSHLTIEKMEAVTYCESCQSTYPTMKYGKTCPNCGSGETWLAKGNECVIKEIEAATAEDLEEADTGE